MNHPGQFSFGTTLINWSIFIRPQQRGDGTVFPALLDCAAQKVGTGGTELRIALTDISERRRLEAELAREREHLEQMVFARTAELSHAKDAAEAANLAKSIFLANTGHELRTPMHGIMGMTDLVLHHLTDPKQIDWLTTSQKQAKQLMSTLDDIIDHTVGRMLDLFDIDAKMVKRWKAEDATAPE